jgi:hypothetical protein
MLSILMAKVKKSAASGEQSAIAGYQKQYEYSACEIYRLMQEGTLRGVTISDPHAGIFDDLVLHVGQEIRASQIKSEQDPTSIALNTELIKNELIKEIAASRHLLCTRFPDAKVKLRYVFGGFFSTSDKALANDDVKAPKHSAEFARFLRREDFTPEVLKDSAWSESLATLQTLSGLNDKDFVALLNDLELLDYRELARNRIDNFPVDERPRLEAIQSLIPRLVARRESRKYLSEGDLLRELGWRKLSQKNVHDFPVPDDFQDNELTRDALLKAISDNTSGYLSLVGPPGTGKSTLLQTALFSTPEYSVSRYLAYLPHHGHRLGRAEAGEFLNDVIAELMGLGLGGSRYAVDDLAGLRGQLAIQLEQASKRYSETNRKTVLVIDGLDHVPREETPASSFLKELPHTQSIPDGVLIVLGTQTLDLADLKSSVVQQAKAKERCIEIAPLSRAAIFSMADDAASPDFVDRAELYEACTGHPLTARYFLEALKGTNSKEEADRVLSQSDGLGRTLSDIYSRIWTGLAAEGDAKSALGLLARADVGLTPEQLASAYGDQAVETIISKAGFLLGGVGGDRLSIFHNSFRLYVAEQTRIRYGKPDVALEADFNKRLAEIAAKANSDDPQHWMELRYRARSGDNEAVLRIGIPDYFRKSLAAFRPSTEIYIDLRLTYAAVKPTRSRTLLLNKLLIEKELEYRLEAVSQLDMVGLFLDLDEPDLAIKHALEIGDTGHAWLRLVDVLWEEGHHALARRVLEANEPLEVFFDKESFDAHQSIQEACEWIQRAQRFRPLDRLVSMVGRIPLKSEFHNEGSIRQSLLYRIAVGVVGDQPDTDIPAICAKLGLDNESMLRLRLEAARDALDAGERDRALAHLGACDGQDWSALDASWKGFAANIAYRAGSIELARKLIRTLSIPSLSAKERGAYADSFADIGSTIFNRYVLSGLLNENIPLEARDDGNAFLNAVDDKIRELASLRVALQNNGTDSDALLLRGLVLYFSHAKPDRGDFSSHKFYAMLGWIAETIVLIGQRLGPARFWKIVEFVDKKIAQGGNNLSGSEAFQLAWASALYCQDGNVEHAKMRIERAEALPRSDRTPQEVVEYRALFAKAYSAIGLTERAHQTLSAMHADTFGYWLRAKKEPQYEFWAWSYLKACEADPANAGQRALEFGRFVLGMDETEGDETARRLIGDLLEGASASPPALGALTARLMDSDLTSWAEVADSVLAAIGKQKPELSRSALLAFSRLVVPFYSARFDRCIPACFAGIKSAEHREAAAPLLHAIRKWCPPSERANILKKLVEAAPGLEDDLNWDIEAAEALVQILQSKTHGSFGDAESRSSREFDAPTLAELLKLGEGKTEYGNGVDYSYARSAEYLALKSGKQELEAFLHARPHLERDANFLVACSRSLLSAGDRTAAKDYFIRAEKAAFSGHWSSFMGGQKLELQEQRIALDGDSGRERGFDVLIDELASGQTYGSSLFLNLDRVLDQITVTHSYGTYWSETEAHLREYREYRLASPILPLDGLTTHSSIVAFLLAQAFDLYCPEIWDHARAAAVQIASRPDSAPIIDKLFALLHDQVDGAREAAALLFRIRSMAHLKAVLIHHARLCVENPDFVVSNLGERVLHELGEALPDDGLVPLPAFYSLAPSGSAQANNFDPPPGLSPGSRPVWTDDPWTLTSVLRFPFHIVADHSTVELEVLRRRCACFMLRSGGREAFGPDAEEALQVRLKRLDLKFSWRRLLPMAAQRAFGMMLKELARAEEISPQAFPMVWEEIGGPSLRGYDLEFEARPSWITYPDLPGRKHGGIENDTWLFLAEDDLFVPHLPEWFVLAERNYFKARIWRENADSTRLCLPGVIDIDRTSDDLNDLPRLFSLDNLQPLYNENESKLVCQLYQPYFSELREATMTICPYVARKLGWVRSRKNPFEVRDKEGRVMARTLRWVDGTDQPGTYESEIYGEGQLLLLSAVARMQVEQLAGPISLQVKVTRRINRDTGDTQERIIAAKTDRTALAGSGLL